jgi:hypothetical protein
MTLEPQPEPTFTQTCRQGVQEGVANEFKAAALVQAPRGEVYPPAAATVAAGGRWRRG